MRTGTLFYKELKQESKRSWIVPTMTLIAGLTWLCVMSLAIYN